MKVRGNSRKNLLESKGGLSCFKYTDQMVLVVVRQGGLTTRAVAKSNSRGQSGLSLLSSYCSRDSQAGRLDHISSGQKTLNVKLNL